MNKQEEINEVLFQLHQGHFEFAEKLINAFQLDCFSKEEWGFRYKKDEIEIEFFFDGTKYWFKNEQLHRDGDKPAVVFANGTKYWFKNGKRHRDGDKPAIVWFDGRKEWWVNGKLIRKE